MEELKQFDEYYSKAENKSVLMKYLSALGGCDAKDHTNRIMKILFTNEFAMSCSWLGLRQNNRIAGFHVVEMIQNMVNKQHGATLKYVETIMSQWFRHAKQRYTRENN